MKVQKEENRFFINENDEFVGEISFTKESNYIIADHTFVNPKYRGKGIASILLDALGDYARKNKVKIKADCSYVFKKFSEFSEYDDIKLK